MARLYSTSDSQKRAIRSRAYGEHGLKTQDIETVLDMLHDPNGMTKSEFDKRREKIRRDGAGRISQDKLNTVFDVIDEHVYGVHQDKE